MRTFDPLPAGRERPLSGRLTFRFSGGAAAPSAATGYWASLCPWRRSTTWVAFSDATN